MRNSIASGRRLAARIVLAQVAASIIVAVALVAQGTLAALGALSGGLVVALATALSAGLAFRRQVSGPHVALTRLALGLAVRWTVTFYGLYLALVHWKLPPLPVIAGLAAALTINLFGLRFKE